MRRILLLVLLAVATPLVSPAYAHDHNAHPMPVAVKARTPQAIEFRNSMRRVWEDHIVWTRNVILSFAHDLPDKAEAVERLLKNQVDISVLFQPYYGSVNAATLASLLKDHIVIAADILAAAKAGDNDAVGRAVVRWQANADDISAFLTKLNPRNWPLAEMKPMMREHLDLTLKEAVARLSGDYKGDIAAYDEVHDAILAMADMLSMGIIAQRPAAF